MSNSRTNDATNANIDKTRIFASGTFKDVWAGVYTGGARQGQRCVAKEFKTGSVYEDHYFEEEMRTIRRTTKIVDDFEAAGVIAQGGRILVNTPAIWEYEDTGHKCLTEPMIDNFEKFNSNTGWAPVLGTDWSDAMQGLSHFSYHNSNGRLLLCDIQGGVYSNGFVLSDPAIMSQAQDYGPTDLGPDGINAFFQRHRCGRFCSRQWAKPAVARRAAIPMRQGTTMMHARLPTRQTQNPLRRLRF